MRLVLAILCVVLVGCQAQKPKLRAITIPSVQAQAQGASTFPVGIPTALTWISTNTQFRVYISPDKTRWALGYVVNTNVATVQAQLGWWYYVTAVEGNLESEPSNKLQLVAKTNAIIVTGEHAASPDGPWQAYEVPVFSGPASESMQVFRVKARTTSGWQTVSEP